MVKCHQYWPDERINRISVYGELLVTIGKRQTEKDYLVTTFLVQHRDVSHIHVHISYLDLAMHMP